MKQFEQITIKEISQSVPSHQARQTPASAQELPDHALTAMFVSSWRGDVVTLKTSSK